MKMLKLLLMIPENFGWVLVGATAMIALMMMVKTVKCFVAELFVAEEE